LLSEKPIAEESRCGSLDRTADGVRATTDTAAAADEDDDDDAAVGAEREAAHCGADGTSLLSSTLSRSSSTTDDGDILHLMPERLSIVHTIRALEELIWQSVDISVFGDEGGGGGG